ncbi:MAG TPA: hypothetical protein VGE36_08755 [Roseateles sp.]
MRALHLTPLLIVLAGPAFGQDASLQRCRVIADTAARLACYDALADARPKPPAPPAAPVAAAPAAKPADSFGLPAKRPEGEPQVVQSSVGADFAGWGPNQSIKLANGQVWRIVDGSSVSMPRGARKVSVRRGLFGDFLLDIEGLNTSPKVRRVE